jgi:hypothetical protein
MTLRDKHYILEPEVGAGHPLAVGLPSHQHGRRGGVKAAPAPEGLGLDTVSGHAIPSRPTARTGSTVNSKTTSDQLIFNVEDSNSIEPEQPKNTSKGFGKNHFIP